MHITPAVWEIAQLPFSFLFNLHAEAPAPSEDMESHMRKLLPVVGIIAVTTLCALIFWDLGTNPTGAASSQLKFGDVVTSAPYLPIQRLEPVY